MTMVKAVSLLKPMKSLQVNVFISTIWAEAEPMLIRAMAKVILKIKPLVTHGARPSYPAHHHTTFCKDARMPSLIDSLYGTLEMMQRNFWKTIKADGNNRCSDTDRGIAHHIAMLPWSRAHMPWQNRIKSDCDGPGQTDLTSMGVAAQKQIETSMCCLAVNFRRMRQQN